MRFRTRQGEVTALERISLTVPNGQFACIVGPSGCGKSTLLMIAAGLITPTEGEVLVNGTPTFEAGTGRGGVVPPHLLSPLPPGGGHHQLGPRGNKVLLAEPWPTTEE